MTSFKRAGKCLDQKETGVLSTKSNLISFHLIREQEISHIATLQQLAGQLLQSSKYLVDW